MEYIGRQRYGKESGRRKMEGVELSVDKLTESMPVPLEVTERLHGEEAFGRTFCRMAVCSEMSAQNSLLCFEGRDDGSWRKGAEAEGNAGTIGSAHAGSSHGHFRADDSRSASMTLFCLHSFLGHSPSPRLHIKKLHNLYCSGITWLPFLHEHLQMLPWVYVLKSDRLARTVVRI